MMVEACHMEGLIESKKNDLGVSILAEKDEREDFIWSSEKIRDCENSRY